MTIKDEFPFFYNSDCRGESIFYPLVDGKPLHHPQIPISLPTYDEVIGRGGISDDSYNDYMINLIKPGKLNVLTIHAEVEGMACAPFFEDFLKKVISKGFLLKPLSALMENANLIQHAAVVAKEISGREGWVACQSMF